MRWRTTRVTKFRNSWGNQTAARKKYDCSPHSRHHFFCTESRWSSRSSSWHLSWCKTSLVHRDRWAAVVDKNDTVLLFGLVLQSNYAHHLGSIAGHLCRSSFTTVAKRWSPLSHVPWFGGFVSATRWISNDVRTRQCGHSLARHDAGSTGVKQPSFAPVFHFIPVCAQMCAIRIWLIMH